VSINTQNAHRPRRRDAARQRRDGGYDAVIKIDDEFIDLDKVTRSRLIELKGKLDSEVLEIKLQLDEYDMNYKVNKISGDYSWFVSAKRAKMIKQKHLIAINSALVQRPKELNSTGKRLDGYFVDVAKEYLGEDDFYRILKLAEDRRANG
jgi:hypothetical protein